MRALILFNKKIVKNGVLIHLRLQRTAIVDKNNRVNPFLNEPRDPQDQETKEKGWKTTSQDSRRTELD